VYCYFVLQHEPRATYSPPYQLARAAPVAFPPQKDPRAALQKEAALFIPAVCSLYTCESEPITRILNFALSPSIINSLRPSDDLCIFVSFLFRVFFRAPELAFIPLLPLSPALPTSLRQVRSFDLPAPSFCVHVSFLFHSQSLFPALARIMRRLFCGARPTLHDSPPDGLSPAAVKGFLI